jgi:hypothetical protein
VVRKGGEDGTLSTEAMTAMRRRSWTALSCQLMVMVRVEGLDRVRRKEWEVGSAIYTGTRTVARSESEGEPAQRHGRPQPKPCIFPLTTCPPLSFTWLSSR